MSPVCDPNLVLLLCKGDARFFREKAGRDIANLRAVRQLLTGAVPFVLLLSSCLDKDKVRYCVPGVVNTCEE